MLELNGYPTALEDWQSIHTMPESHAHHSFWSGDVESLLSNLNSSPTGLTQHASSERLRKLRVKKPCRDHETLWLLLGQFKSPITLILIFAACLSFFLRDSTDAVLILGVVVASALLGFWQEYSAAGAMKKLLALVTSSAAVLRDGIETALPTDAIVPGDVIVLRAGSTIVADCRLLQSRDLFVGEAMLTGETYPVEKQPGDLPSEIPLAQRSNSLFQGTNVISGSGTAVVAQVGEATELGRISHRLHRPAPETDFERGVRRFGYFLVEVTLLLVVTIFAINVFFHEPVLETFLFALALAVGLTPQLLPAIISVNLSHGARRMAKRDVIVRRLSSIENVGSMDVLCSDKTGTLTEGVVRLREATDGLGSSSRKTLLFARINAYFESGFANPIDQAIRSLGNQELADYQKRAEVPYDFIRKRLSILVGHDDESLLITKGAVDNVLAVCSTAELADGRQCSLSDSAAAIHQKYIALGDAGFRTLGIAYRIMPLGEVANKDAEQHMVFLGFLVLHDPPKQDVADTIETLRGLGVGLKIITGDNRRVAASVAKQIGLPHAHLVTGESLYKLSDDALVHRVSRSNVFAEIEPNQKERIILALRKAGHVVGYLGDGINDATALHAADVGISVDSAVDVAKEAADLVLLKRDLNVLIEGVREGRQTFANTMKYVFMATSANFGNMFSMAIASLFLNFLPLLPKQILLMNLLTDLPEMTIAQDTVDAELVRRPPQWDIRFISRFMLVFGTLSSLCDLLTFAILMYVFKANAETFRSGWFIESVVSAALVVLIVRTRRPLWRSSPNRWLVITTLLTICVTFLLPWMPNASLLGFAPLPATMLAAIVAIVLMYAVAAEMVKAIFYRGARFQHSSDRRGNL